MRVPTKFVRGLMVMVICILVVSVVQSPVSADENTPISMDFKGADLRDVFRTLAQIAQVNVITHQSVSGEITVTLNEVPFNEAIDLITLINDLEYRWVGKTLLIASPEKLEENFTKQRTETFKIQYAQLDKLREIMDNLIHDGTVLMDQRTRSIMVTAAEGELARAKEVITDLDVPIPQIFLDVRVEEISTTGLEQMGVQQGVHAKIKLITDAKGLITDIGLELPQVIDILEKEGLSKTLANPGLITLDGEAAQLLIGDKVPVEAQEEIDGKLKTVIKYIEAGIRLDFTPRVSNDGYITLNVKPQVSSLGEYLTKGYPLIRSREVETIVRIRDGQTFVIGGLIRDEDRTSLEKVPLLGDIPILGALFRHDETSKRSTEVVIFITPKIIYPEEQDQVEEWIWQESSFAPTSSNPNHSTEVEEAEVGAQHNKSQLKDFGQAIHKITYRDVVGGKVND